MCCDKPRKDCDVSNLNRQSSLELAAMNSSFCTLAQSQRWQKVSPTRLFRPSSGRLHFLVAPVKRSASVLASHYIHAMGMMENRFSGLQTGLFTA